MKGYFNERCKAANGRRYTPSSPPGQIVVVDETGDDGRIAKWVQTGAFVPVKQQTVAQPPSTGASAGQSPSTPPSTGASVPADPPLMHPPSDTVKDAKHR